MNAPSYLRPRNIYFVSLGLYLVLALSALSLGITSWDEETDYIGLRSQLVHAIEIFRGNNPDYRDIHANLEYYGVVSLLPAWVIWFVTQSFLVGRTTLAQALFFPSAEHQLTGFYSASHLILILEMLYLSYIVIENSKALSVKCYWFSGALILFIPSLQGHSFVNPKDFPFAVAYTAYTYYSTLRIKSLSSSWANSLWSALFAGLLINLKLVFLAPLLVTEFFILIFNCMRKVSLKLITLQSLSIFSLSLCLSLLLQPASWAINPIEYITEAFNAFSHHVWGGCMWFSSSCIGIYNSNWNSGIYIVKWLSVKVPYLLLVLIVVKICSALWKSLYVFKGISRMAINYVPLLLQLGIFPAAIILSNTNIYDADRHLLFIYPPLVILSVSALDTILTSKFKLIRSFLLATTILLSVVLVIDCFLLNPYQISYFNEASRNFHGHFNTSTDYWGVSSKELIRNAQLNQSLGTPPTLRPGIWISPFWIAFRQLAGQLSNSRESQSPLFQLRDVPAFSSHESRDCTYASSVERRLLMSSPIRMSSLYLCND